MQTKRHYSREQCYSYERVSMQLDCKAGVVYMHAGGNNDGCYVRLGQVRLGYLDTFGRIRNPKTSVGE